MYTAPSALPSTSFPSARRAIAVKSVSARRRYPPAGAARRQIDHEVAAAGREIGRAAAVAGQRGRRPGQRDRTRRPARSPNTVTWRALPGWRRSTTNWWVPASNTAASARAGER